MVGPSREDVLRSVREFHEKNKAPQPANRVPVSGKVFDSEELANAVSAVLDCWWTEGEWNARFEKQLASFVGTTRALTVNSGSSANLVAFTTLLSPKLGEKRIRKGDEVITAACAFPTTVNPILQAGCIPVFVDVELGTYDVTAEAVEAAITDKTKAIFLAHTLGNPFDAERLRKVADERGIWLIEDSCDALGSTLRGRRTGSFGHLSTFSFYPAHQITTGEGGAVLTSDPKLYKIARSVRDWGRDCWCPTGKDDTCKKRFSWKLGELPEGYDHKYIYSEAGYNLKLTDLQAAIGVAQMGKLDLFIAKRKENFAYLTKRFNEEGLDAQFLLPRATEGSEPCWFGFPLTIREDSKLGRTRLLETLNKNGVGTRLIFGGNLTKQPYFIENKFSYRVHRTLENTDTIMNKSFWIGVYPALGEPQLEHAVSQIRNGVKTARA